MISHDNNIPDDFPIDVLEESTLERAEDVHKKVIKDLPYPLYMVKLLYSSETQYCSCHAGIHVFPGLYVIVQSRYGRDLGRILGEVNTRNVQDKGIVADDIYTIYRLATQADFNRVKADKDLEKEAFEICKKKIHEHKLEMKLIAAHYLADESKILFFFTAEARVDFRELVKDLVGLFKTRIELRQIGVRDEARVFGGIAICGRDYCCHYISDKLRPVSIRMAKEQNLSLNSMKISGPCSRLLCCLSYEFETYCEEKRHLPSEGATVNYDGSNFRIQEVNIITKMIRMDSSDGRILYIPFNKFSCDEQKHWHVADVSSH